MRIFLLTFAVIMSVTYAAEARGRTSSMRSTISRSHHVQRVTASRPVTHTNTYSGVSPWWMFWAVSHDHEESHCEPDENKKCPNQETAGE